MIKNKTYKIIFFDADGTLFSHKQNAVPKSTITAINKLKERGYLISLATGRSKLLTGQLGIFQDIDFDYFVTINGTLVLDKNNDVIYQKPIGKEEIDKIIKITNDHGLNLVFISKDDYYLLKPADKRSHLAYDPLHIKIPPVKEYCYEDIFQINLFCEDEYLSYFTDEVPNLAFSKLDDYGYDFFSADQSKAVGIQALIESLNIAKSETMAFGDGHNDEEMIRFVGMGIAMGNAIPKIKNASDYITSDIDEDGIKKGLEFFKLIEEE